MDNENKVTIQGTTSAPVLSDCDTVFTLGSITIGPIVNGRVQVWTGLGDAGGHWIINHGLDFERMRRYCPLADKLWTTWDFANAWGYSDISVCVRQWKEARAVIGIGMLPGVVQGFVESGLAGIDIEDRAIWFEPATFTELNATCSFSIQLSADLKIEE